MTGIRRVPEVLPPWRAPRPSTNLYPDMEAFVDLITMHDDRGLPHSYARTKRGFHVPIECMRHEDIRAALEARGGQ